MNASPIDKQLVEKELETLLSYIEDHLRWAKAQDQEGLARLNIIAAESLIESAGLVRALCEELDHPGPAQ